ncbi:hypothetical protein KSS87_005465 [Heliosperma pusillum]|nr:hypothetical protein KSS87_005465 [Heliosperma pusillum]
MDKIDRISELPEFILHIILSKIDTKDAFRASVLSKRWYRAWSSVPVLDFNPKYFKKERVSKLDFYDHYYPQNDYMYDNFTVQQFIRFIDKTMQRYLTRKYRISKLDIVLPYVDETIQPLVDKWIGIMVQNQIQELNINVLLDGQLGYGLPEILFRAKSLKVLTCNNVELRYYEIVDLVSLECLSFSIGTLDEGMLHKIISLSPLVKLCISYWNLRKISLPWTRGVYKGAECVGSETMRYNLKTSPLQEFVYHGLCSILPWAWDMNVSALKNLRNVKIDCAAITDDIVSEMVCGLVALESLELSSCSMLECLKISSISLKKFRIDEAYDGHHLMKITIDTPNLLNFSCSCDVEANLSLIRAQDHCNTCFIPSWVKSVTTVWFVKLKKFLVETNCFQSVVIDLGNFEQIEIDEELLRIVVATGSPYKLRELKLRITNDRFFTQSSQTAFLDALFWSCSPDVLSISFKNMLPELIMGYLKRKVECWKHPLKKIEVEGVDCSSLLSETSQLEFSSRVPPQPNLVFGLQSKGNGAPHSISLLNRYDQKPMCSVKPMTVGFLHFCKKRRIKGRKKRMSLEVASHVLPAFPSETRESIVEYIEEKYLTPRLDPDEFSPEAAGKDWDFDWFGKAKLPLESSFPRTTVALEWELPFRRTKDKEFGRWEPQSVEVEISELTAGAEDTDSLPRINGAAKDFVRGSINSRPFRPGGLDNSHSLSRIVPEGALNGEWVREVLEGGPAEKHPPSFKQGLDLGDLKAYPCSWNVNNDQVSLKSVSDDKQSTLSLQFDDLFKRAWEEDLGENDERESDGGQSEVCNVDSGVELTQDETSVDVLNVKSLELDEILSVESSAVSDVKFDEKNGESGEKKEVWAIRGGSLPIADRFHELVPDMALDFPFELDSFQKEAIYYLEQGKSVFVAAHTSAGKTVVAEYAFALASKHCTRAVYTAPIKTISNQKYRDFTGKFDVGLLTGDISLRPEASCLIMTTEILRSMLYKGADIIRDIEWVIFDEVHYVNDAERGVVWEEVIIMLPRHINIVLLSATVPNTIEFADWIGRTKQKTIRVTGTTRRPVPLEHCLFYSGELYRICENEAFVPQGMKAAKDAHKKKNSSTARSGSAMSYGSSAGSGAAHTQNRDNTYRGQQKHSGSHNSGNLNEKGANGNQNNFGLRRSDVSLWLQLVNKLLKKSLLPVIVFCFSKNRCDRSADSMTSIDLTSGSEKSEIRVFCDKAFSRLKGSDRNLPQILRVESLLRRGIGVHHAGLLPIVKEVIEMLFCRGVIKVLFSTETFAMGVNAPARTPIAIANFRWPAIAVKRVEFVGGTKTGSRNTDVLWRYTVFIAINETCHPDVNFLSAFLLYIADLRIAMAQLSRGNLARSLALCSEYYILCWLSFKRVVFDTLRKFDGKEFRQIIPGEYTQMAGRAGRRGLDKFGTVIIMCRDEIPEESDMKQVIVGNPTRLESQFRLTYIMILHLLRVEELKVEDMLKRSFAEFHAQKNIPEKQQLLMRKLAQPAKAIETLPDRQPAMTLVRAQDTVRCIKGEPAIEEYYRKYKEAEGYLDKITDGIMQSHAAQTFLVPGRVVVVKSPTTQDHLLGVVVKAPSASLKKYIVLVLRPDLALIAPSTSAIGATNDKGGGKPAEVLLLLPKSKRALDDEYYSASTNRKGSGVINIKLPHQGVTGGKHFEVREVDNREFLYICNCKLKIDQVRLLEDVSTAAYSKTVQQILDLIPNGNKYPPALDPVKDLKLKNMDLVASYYKWNKLLEEMAENKCHGCIKLDEHMKSVKEIFKHRDEVDMLKFQMSDEALQQMPDFQGRIDVLKKVGCIDDDLVVQIKGRVACEMNSGEELICTECLFENQMGDLEPEEAVAVMSAFVFQQKNASEPSLTPKLSKAVRSPFPLVRHRQEPLRHTCFRYFLSWIILYDTAIRLGELQAKFNLPIDPEEYAQDNLKFGLVEVVYEWAKGTEFADICELTDVPEGLIVRTIVRLDETCREFKNAASIMGNSALYKKMEAASNAIKRDIVFAASLYITGV